MAWCQTYSKTLSELVFTKIHNAMALLSILKVTASCEKGKRDNFSVPVICLDSIAIDQINTDHIG